MLLVSKNGPIRTKIILLPIKTTFEAIVKNETVAVKIKKKKKENEKTTKKTRRESTLGGGSYLFRPYITQGF